MFLIHKAISTNQGALFEKQGQWSEENERKIKNIKLNDYNEYYNQLDLYQTFSSIHLRTTAKQVAQLVKTLQLKSEGSGSNPTKPSAGPLGQNCGKPTN